ncbi:hypothetical protein D9M70_617450 [compost metagenome]
MWAGVVEGTIAIRFANDDDVIVLEVEDPSFVELKVLFSKSANPPSAAMSDGFAGRLGVEFGVDFGP